MGNKSTITTNNEELSGDRMKECKLLKPFNKYIFINLKTTSYST